MNDKKYKIIIVVLVVCVFAISLYGYNLKKIVSNKKEIAEGTTFETTTNSTTRVELTITTETSSVYTKSVSFYNLQKAVEEKGYTIGEYNTDLYSDKKVLISSKNATFYIRCLHTKGGFYKVEVFNDFMENKDDYKECIATIAETFNPSKSTSELYDEIDKKLRQTDDAFRCDDVSLIYFPGLKKFEISYR